MFWVPLFTYDPVIDEKALSVIVFIVAIDHVQTIDILYVFHFNRTLQFNETSHVSHSQDIVSVEAVDIVLDIIFKSYFGIIFI